MLSSFLKRAALLGLIVAPQAWAQQNYFVPIAEVSAERHSNRELATSAEPHESNAYKATLAARTGRATPRSQTELRPRLVFQEFPDQSGIDRLEYFLDVGHEYRTLKGRFELDA